MRTGTGTKATRTRRSTKARRTNTRTAGKTIRTRLLNNSCGSAASLLQIVITPSFYLRHLTSRLSVGFGKKKLKKTE